MFVSTVGEGSVYTYSPCAPRWPLLIPQLRYFVVTNNLCQHCPGFAPVRLATQGNIASVIKLYHGNKESAASV